MFHSLGLLPFSQGVVARVAVLAAHHAARHPPAMLSVEITGQGLQFRTIMRHLHRAHVIGFDPAPHRVGMATQLPIHADLFVKHDGAGLSLHP